MIQTRPNELRPDDPAGAPGNETADRLRQHGEDVKRQVGDVRQVAGDAVSQASDKLLEAGRQAKDTVLETARQTTGQAKERASTVLASQKTRLADEVSVFAEALHKAADTLDEHEDRAIGLYVHRAADCVDTCVNYLRERDASEMVRQVGSFTRRHPEVVLGGLFLVGVAAARFLKASDRRSERMSFEGDYDRDYGYMDTGRGLESENLYGNPVGGGYADAGYGDIGMYAGDDVSGYEARGMNEPFGATGGATLDRSVGGDVGVGDEVTGLSPFSREDRGQSGDPNLVPDMPREEPSLSRNCDIPSSTAPQPGSYPPVTPSGTFFQSSSGQGDKPTPNTPR